MQKGSGREHNSPESKEIFANGFIWSEGLWYHRSWIGKSMCGETFDLTFRHNAAFSPKTLSSMSLKGESCHCNITYVPPTDGVLFDLILGKASWISSYTETGFRKLCDTASSHSLPKNILRWSNTFGSRRISKQGTFHQLKHVLWVLQSLHGNRYDKG